MKTLKMVMMRGVMVLALVLGMGLAGFGSAAAQTEEGGFTLPDGVSPTRDDVLLFLGITPRLIRSAHPSVCRSPRSLRWPKRRA